MSIEMFKPTLVDSNCFSARITVLSKHTVEACETVRSPLPHNIPLSAQVSVAFEAGEMFHMPGSTLRLGAFIREYDLKKRRGSNRFIYIRLACMLKCVRYTVAGI